MKKAFTQLLLVSSNSSLVSVIRSDWKGIPDAGNYYLTILANTKSRIEAALAISAFLRVAKKWKTDASKLIKKELIIRMEQQNRS